MYELTVVFEQTFSSEIGQTFTTQLYMISASFSLVALSLMKENCLFIHELLLEQADIT